MKNVNYLFNLETFDNLSKPIISKFYIQKAYQTIQNKVIQVIKYIIRLIRIIKVIRVIIKKKIYLKSLKIKIKLLIKIFKLFRL